MLVVDIRFRDIEVPYVVQNRGPTSSDQGSSPIDEMFLYVASLVRRPPSSSRQELREFVYPHQALLYWIGFFPVHLFCTWGSKSKNTINLKIRKPTWDGSPTPRHNFSSSPGGLVIASCWSASSNAIWYSLNFWFSRSLCSKFWNYMQMELIVTVRENACMLFFLTGTILLLPWFTLENEVKSSLVKNWNQ